MCGQWNMKKGISRAEVETMAQPVNGMPSMAT